MTRILLVEDDPMIGDAVRRGLQQEGLAVDWTPSGQEALDAFAVEPYDLMILDLGLPDISGLDVLKTLRSRGASAPVIILTAWDQVSQRILGLDSGADDYMIKPFDLDELAARVRALLRRNTGRATPTIRIGDLEVDPTKRKVVYRDREIFLSPREFALLSLLAGEPERVFSKEQLEEKIYGWDDEIASNTIEVHIHNIRKKTDTGLIRNVRGLGYILGPQR